MRVLFALAALAISLFGALPLLGSHSHEVACTAILQSIQTESFEREARSSPDGWTAEMDAQLERFSRSCL